MQKSSEEIKVVIAVIAVLMAILMPALRRAREQARMLGCSSNLRQWVLIMNAYCMENDGEFFSGVNNFGHYWPWQLKEDLTCQATMGLALYEDEIDIHLNPQIGPDYMLPGQQKTVLTPAKNVKHHVAGALDAQTERVIWVDGKRKCRALFIELLRKLDRVYASKRVIHLILDNSVIHTSKITQRAFEQLGGRIILHFLPRYCPDDNKIEWGVWRNLHANVTGNHKCRTMAELMTEVRDYLAKVNRAAVAKRRRKAA